MHSVQSRSPNFAGSAARPPYRVRRTEPAKCAPGKGSNFLLANTRGVTEVQSKKRWQLPDAAAASRVPRRRLAGAHQSWQRSACATARASKRSDLRPGWAREAGQPQRQTAPSSQPSALRTHPTLWDGSWRERGRTATVSHSAARAWSGAQVRGPSEGRLAPSPPPTPAGCRGGAQRQPSLPGPRSGKRGRQHASVRALAPDSRLPTQIRASGLNPRTGSLQSGLGEAKAQSPGGGVCMSLPASTGQAREPV